MAKLPKFMIPSVHEVISKKKNIFHHCWICKVWLAQEIGCQRDKMLSIMQFDGFDTMMATILYFNAAPG